MDYRADVNQQSEFMIFTLNHPYLYARSVTASNEIHSLPLRCVSHLPVFPAIADSYNATAGTRSLYRSRRGQTG
jgi:hypothetical protein